MSPRLEIAPLEKPVPPMSAPCHGHACQCAATEDLSQLIGASAALDVAVNIDRAHVDQAEDHPTGVTRAADERAAHGHARQRAAAED